MRASEAFVTDISSRLAELKADGLYKSERIITSPQAGEVTLQGGARTINLCANNYLGLADDPELVETAKAALDRYGYGMASVRFICGTQEEHKTLESRIAAFLGMEDAILYAAAFDANAGLFETLLGPEDAIISDALNHASIIDGIRLSKARRLRYANSDMSELEAALRQSQDSRHRLIATDGVFSMDGYIARLDQICDLAESYNAMVMVDDCHATGFLGATGRGSHEQCNVMGRVDIITGTLGKALGGASGGFTAARAGVVDWLRQRSRPYLFSNTLAPVITSASLHVFDILEARGADLRARLWRNAARFRAEMGAAGFTLLPGEHAIIPVMLGDPVAAQDMAMRLGRRGVFVTAFSFPVVPRGQDRIRTQMSAGHTDEMLDRAIAAFVDVGRDMGLIG
ncbi:MAG: glycine C-acetyltransferase [Pseudomonadota bacterium]